MSYDPRDAKDLFLHAVELRTPEEREAYLDRACQGNVQLRARVDDLLRAHANPDRILQRPAMEELMATMQCPGSTDRAQGMPPLGGASGTAPADHVPLDFLQPCATPGRIGKLGVYEIIEVVGQGGMGIVLKAHDTKLERVVAIKVLAPSLAFNPMARQRFLREARAAAAVSHDHVVTIFAVEEASDPPYLVMECIAGQSLQQKIDRRGALEPAEILRIGMQIAAGLAAAHKQGLIHRDIKPSNILLENGVERVKITDFGLARSVDDITMTQTGQVTGTPEYMSPEQAKGERLDARSDLFSMGSVLYTMCTGRPAFRADSALAVLRRVCDDTPRPVAEINRAIPHALLAVVGKLLAKRPDDRFQSAADVSELLSDALAWLQQPEGRTPPRIPTVLARRAGWWWRPIRYLGYLAAAAFLLWAILLPTFRLLVANQAKINFEFKDGDTTVELLREGHLVATQVGYGQISVPAGTYEFRIREKPPLRFWQFLFERRNWWMHNDQVSLMSPPQALPLRRGDEMTVWVSFVEVQAEAKAEAISQDTRAAADAMLLAAPFSEQQARAAQTAWAKRLEVPADYEDPLGIAFRLIPPGKFLMGDLPEEVNGLLRELELNEAGDFEKFAVRSSAPRHPVRVSKPFYLARCEVTVAQFKKFAAETGYQSTLEAVKSAPFTWRALAEQHADEQLPVDGLSWEDARAFCRWLSKRHGVSYELPTEAQWEYACRAGSEGRWSFGDDKIPLPRHAVCAKDDDSGPAPVGKRLTNAFGLFDMHGNVDEWCLDWHKADFYSRSPTDDPLCTESVADPASGRVVRGGSWDRPVWMTRSACRSYDFAGLPVRRHGFRVAIVGDLKKILQVKANPSK